MSVNQRDVRFKPCENEIDNIDQNRKMSAANESIAKIQGDKRKHEKIQASNEPLAKKISFDQGGFENNKINKNGQIVVANVSLEDLHVEAQQAVNIPRAMKVPLNSDGFNIHNMVQNKPVAAANSLLAEYQDEKQEEIQTANESLAEKFLLYKGEFENDNIGQNIPPVEAANASVSELRAEKQQVSDVPLSEELPLDSCAFQTDNLIQNKQLTASEEYDTNLNEIQVEVQTDINTQVANAQLAKEIPLNSGGIKTDNIAQNRQLVAAEERNGNFGRIQTVQSGMEAQAAIAPLAEERPHNPGRIEIDNTVQYRQLAVQEYNNDEVVERLANIIVGIIMRALINMGWEPIDPLGRKRG